VYKNETGGGVALRPVFLFVVSMMSKLSLDSARGIVPERAANAPPYRATEMAGRFFLLMLVIVLRRHGVIALAHLHLQRVALALKPDSPEGSIELEVGGRIAGNILRAQFILNLLEGCFKLLAVVAHIDQASACLIGYPLGRGIATVAHVEPAIELAVGDQNHINDHIVLLRGGNGFANLGAAALVFAVGQDDDRLAARLPAQLFVGCKVDRII